MFAWVFRENVAKANPYRDAGGKWSSKEKAKTVTTMEQDMTRQSKWLTERAKELGHPDVDTLVSQDLSKFFDLTKRWRRTHSFKSINEVLNLSVL